jgi:hypothetical protein
MESVDTSDLSTNKFIVDFIRWEYKLVNQWNILTYIELWPSFESIVRSRRKVIADHGIWKRNKADTEEEYIEEFARTNKF